MPDPTPKTKRNTEIVRAAREGDKNLGQLADEFKISRQRVQQILRRAGVKLREMHFLTSREVCRRLGIPISIVKVLVRDKRVLPLKTRGKQFVFSESQLPLIEKLSHKVCGLCGGPTIGNRWCKPCYSTPTGRRIRYLARKHITKCASPLYQRILDDMSRGETDVFFAEFLRLSGLSKIQAQYLKTRQLITVTRPGSNYQFSSHEATQIRRFRDEST